MKDIEKFQEQLTAMIRETAVTFPYPPTPDIAAQVRHRLASPPPFRQTRLAWALAVLIMALGLLMAVPQVRAAVIEMVRAGAITIFVSEPTPTAIPDRPDNEEDSGLPPLNSTLSNLAELITLEDAQSQANFSLRLPADHQYGPPDRIYLQEVPDPAHPSQDGQLVIMVWLDPVQPEVSRLRLYQIGLDSYGFKQAIRTAVAETRVNGQNAFWIKGGHRISLQIGSEQESYFVESDVLIWVENNITYRLESQLPLEEAVKIAESLKDVRSK